MFGMYSTQPTHSPSVRSLSALPSLLWTIHNELGGWGKLFPPLRRRCSSPSIAHYLPLAFCISSQCPSVPSLFPCRPLTLASFRFFKLHKMNSTSRSSVKSLYCSSLPLLLPFILCLLQKCDSFPSPGVFGLLQLNDQIHPPPISAYAKLPLEKPWMFVRPVERFGNRTRTHLWHKRAMMRLGKRALMRLG